MQEEMHTTTADVQPQNKNTRLWDQMAEAFSDFTLESPDNNEILRLLTENGMLQREYRVLDIGCAAGKYAIPFAKCCREVVAVDVSANMLARAQENKKRFACENLHLIHSDWMDVDLEEIGGKESFDLVFANMSPGVSTPEALCKMMDVGRCWFYFGGSAGRRRLVNDRIYQLFDLRLHTQANEHRIPQAFSQVWATGYRPQLAYTHSSTKMDMPLKKAVDYYEAALSCVMNSVKMREPDGQELRKLRAFLEEIAVDGVVHEEISGVIAALTWKKEYGR